MMLFVQNAERKLKFLSNLFQVKKSIAKIVLHLSMLNSKLNIDFLKTESSIFKAPFFNYQWNF